MSQLSTNHHKSHPKIIAAIPCLNEAQFIADIVTKAKKYVDRVIVIDDGSTDRTSEIARDAGADVIRHEKRKGAGAATQSGFQAARTNGADILVTLDGDGQHNPDEIPALISPITEGKADLVIGSRFPQPHLNQSQLISINLNHVPKYRKLGIDVITWLYNFGSKMKVSDSQSCFRAHSRKLLQAIEITEPGFGFSVEVLIKARRNGLAIMEVPISCIYHPQGSTDNPITHGLGVAFTVMKLRLFKHQEIIS
ncbi:MAG: glycosyltransferase family 2 protein [Chloroflexi bacterium]|nr:glycosyltransferase family 2 protein [Chloroflexota bacterium]MBM3182548.1 glycosyltransferase family 2 protein [Chloroflexota bacterium]MBM4449670.1 glycosyltransferase family 2 protein [Chloroflexota bacterium]